MLNRCWIDRWGMEGEADSRVGSGGPVPNKPLTSPWPERFSKMLCLIACLGVLLNTVPDSGPEKRFRRFRFCFPFLGKQFRRFRFSGFSLVLAPQWLIVKEEISFNANSRENLHHSSGDPAMILNCEAVTLTSILAARNLQLSGNMVQTNIVNLKLDRPRIVKESCCLGSKSIVGVMFPLSRVQNHFKE